MGNLLNLEVYSVLDVVLFGICCFLWFVVYGVTIYNIHKHKVVDIPVAAVVANFSWELLWSWTFHTNFGELFAIGYKVWFFMDLYIVFCLFKYGKKQFLNNTLASKYYLIVTSGLIFWLVGLYYMIPEHDTDGFGAFSAYLINGYMSALYIAQAIRQPEFVVSKISGWAKMLGTFACTVMIFIHFWDISGFKSLMAMGVITMILDCVYIYISYNSPVKKQFATEKFEVMENV